MSECHRISSSHLYRFCVQFGSSQFFSTAGSPHFRGPTVSSVQVTSPFTAREPGSLQASHTFTKQQRGATNPYAPVRVACLAFFRRSQMMCLRYVTKDNEQFDVSRQVFIRPPAIRRWQIIGIVTMMMVFSAPSF